MRADFVIVGSGLTGAVLARSLHDAGHSVLVLDRRPQAGGNVADFDDEHGLRIQRYGPHFFRTASEAVWQFVNRFTSFYPYKNQIRSQVDGRLENWPIAGSYIRRVCGDNWQPELRLTRPANFEEAALSLMPRVIYEKFVKGYTEKQWGVPARELSANLVRRFDVRHDDSPYLTPKAKHQGMPSEGYSTMVDRMLQGIPVRLDVDYLACREEFRPRRKLIFTGPIDEYFGYSLGKLAYRGQQRSHRHHAEIHDYRFPVAVINNPGEGPHVRDIEWKHMMPPELAAAARGTVITRETPWTPTSPEAYEYPFPDEPNRQLYERYRALAAEEPGLLICGRLGEYRYYDMDHAIARALHLAHGLLTSPKTTG